ncbi:alpha/beta fold hydrolase, partial [Jatrophihabitans endophyticus]|uniref:alpha/beta fold hydrolase n=1 Tax=Jatrophihabitans endophyticus TaxID=1206085 RepID=UPI0019E50F6A
MTGRRSVGRLGSTPVRIAAVAVLVLAAVGVVLGVVLPSGGVTTRSQFVTGTPEAGRKVELDTTLYLPSSTPAPAILLTQGFGGDKAGLDSEARYFAGHGYVVLAYSARGFGASGGLIHFASPHYEIHDAHLLVSWLARQPQVRRVDGKPQIAAAGSSYGGGISLLLAAADHRVDAVAADITWNDLEHAFFPNAAGTRDGPGVFKKLWVGELFGNGFGSQEQSALAALRSGSSSAADPPSSGSTGSVSCGRFAADVCAAYQASAETGRPTPALQRIMAAASPASVLSKIDAPTLLTQGEQDSLFPLSEADANARGIAAHGTPVRVEWRPGGHDVSSEGTGDAESAALSWFGSVFDGSVGAGHEGRQPFRFAEQAGVVSAETGDASQLTLQASGYPGVDGGREPTRRVTVRAPAQRIAAPAGGEPAVITSIPGLGALTAQFGGTLSTLATAPGQTAAFVSSPVHGDLRVVGASSVRLRVTAQRTGPVVLYAGLRDLSPDGSSTLPSQLVSPLRIPHLRAGETRTVTVSLPPVVRNILSGHRLVLTVSTTDFAYDNLSTPRTYTVAVASGAVTVPTLSGTAISAGHPVLWLVVGVIAVVVVALAVGLVLLRRRRVLRPDPSLADVPVSIAGLVKEYRGGYRAVDGVSFRVERGQVVGLLGPNGAGKTTVLRVLVGLITPTEGVVHVFGEPVTPGAPVLARLGAFIEGPGFLPHLTGRENL